MGGLLVAPPLPSSSNAESLVGVSCLAVVVAAVVVGVSKYEGGGVTPSVLETDDLEVGLCEEWVWRRELGEGEGEWDGEWSMGDSRAEVRLVFCSWGR